MRPLRVLHCPDMVGGNSQILRATERELGVDSWAVSFRTSKYQYATDEVLWRDSDSRLLCEAKRWRMLARALWHFDIIHFNFGKTLFPEPAFPPPGVALGLGTRVKNVVARCLELRDMALLRRTANGLS